MKKQCELVNAGKVGKCDPQLYLTAARQEQEEHETDLQHKHVDACTCGRDNDRRDSSKFAEKSASDRSLSCVWPCG